MAQDMTIKEIIEHFNLYQFIPEDMQGKVIVEIERLKADVEDFKKGAEVEARAGDEARAEFAKLRSKIDVDKIEYTINMFVKKIQMEGGYFDLSRQERLAQAIVTYLKEGVK